MSNGSITNVNYPLPSWQHTSSGSTQVLGQMLTVTSTATSQFSAFNADTKLVTLDIQSNNVYCTFDGTTPSSTSGHILYAGANFTWNKGMATLAKFVATTTGTTTIYGSELQI